MPKAAVIGRRRARPRDITRAMGEPGPLGSVLRSVVCCGANRVCSEPFDLPERLGPCARARSRSHHRLASGPGSGLREPVGSWAASLVVDGPVQSSDRLRFACLASRAGHARPARLVGYDSHARPVRCQSVRPWHSCESCSAYPGSSIFLEMVVSRVFWSFPYDGYFFL